MIAFIKGIVYSLENDSVILDHNGMGYRIHLANPFALKIKEEVFLHIYQQVREDAITLFGFMNKEEHDLFIQLINVKGIGAKSVMNMLKGSSANAIVSAIESGDVAFLKKLPGIGAKTASQIVLDLKGKLVATADKESSAPVVLNEALSDAMEAFKALGYKASELSSIEKALAKEEQMSADAYIKKGLILLAQRKGV